MNERQARFAAIKRVVICADDYGMAPGVSEAIRELVWERRLNATSVMTMLPDLDLEARALIACLPHEAPPSVGLHVTLSGDFPPLTDAFGPTYPPLSTLMRSAFAGRLDREALEREVDAQFDAFEDAFSRPPRHVDGHQHVHLLPTVRSVVLEVTRRRAPGAWVRDSTPSWRTLSGLDVKSRIIGLLAWGYRGAAARAGLTTNIGFAGAYDFSGDHDFLGLMERFLTGLPDLGVVMVHPGRVDDPLVARDPLTHQREVEFEVLRSPDFLHLLARLNCTLA